MYRILYQFIYELFHLLVPNRYIAQRIYQKRLGRVLNLKNPQDINEKINWLKYYSDTSQWTMLADKYSVRQFVVDRGLKEILVPLYEKWDKAEDINFDNLPNSFILKTNHGSREIYKVCDKNSEDINSIKVLFKKYLKERYGRYQGEPHYMKIKPCVIAEKLLMVPSNSFTTSLVDYKIWCFNGEPYYIWVCYSRSKERVYVELRDLNWKWHPEKQVYTDHYRDGGGIVPKPLNFDKMLSIARILSKGFPEVCVDLYEHEANVYFGEMTFTRNGGYMDYYTKDFLKELGDQVQLPIKAK